MTHNNHTQKPGWTERPVFRENQRLTPERLNRIHEHQAQRMRMMQLGMAGHGVIYGFKVSTDEDHKCKTDEGKIYIGCGLAIDCMGRQLYWPGGWAGVEDLCGEIPDCVDEYTLQVHYAERHSGNNNDPCIHDEDKADWVEEGIVFTVTSISDCTPACEECPDDCCDENDCNDVCDYACGHIGATDNCVHEDECLNNLCKTPDELCDVACKDWFYDADNGVQLARVEIIDLTGDSKKCDPVMGFSSNIDVCHSRSYVYRNPLLYELIQGCHRDLPRVESLSWEEWVTGDNNNLKTVPWNDFYHRFVPKSGDKSVPPDDAFTINFSKPISIDTLHEASVFLTIYIQERRTDYWEGRRVPLKKIQYINTAESTSSSGYINRIRLIFEDEWIDAEIDDNHSTLIDGILVELTIRGAMLRDECNNMLDAVPLDYAGKNYRQEMLGDDFVVAFSVARWDEGTNSGNTSNSDQREKAD